MRETILRTSLWKWLVMGLCLIPIYIFFCYTFAYGTHRVPIWDEWAMAMFIAIEVKRGALSLNDLFVPTIGHRTVFFMAYTALWTWLTDWNISTSIWIIPIVMIFKYALLLRLVWKFARQHFWVLLLPLTLLVFSFNQADTWLFVVNHTWHMVASWLLLGVLVTCSSLPGWRVVLLAALCAIGATFTLGVGWAVWVVLPIVMWLQGYRRWQYYALWGGLLLLMAFLYLPNSTYQPTQVAYLLPDDLNERKIGDPIIFARAWLAYLGNVPLALGLVDLIGVHELVGLAGLGLLAANLFYLREIRPNLPWIGLALYAMGSGVLIALGRVHIEPNYIFATRFASAAMWLWVALMVTMAKVIPRLRATMRDVPAQRALFYSNMVMIVLLAGLYIPINVVYSLAEERGSDRPMVWTPASQDHTQPFTRCVEEYLLYRNEECRLNLASPETMYQLAVYRLAIYADAESVSVLPASANPTTDQVVINTPMRWINLYIRDYMLKGIDESQILHLAPPDEHVSVDTFPEPLDQVWVMPDEGFAAALTAEQVWYITTPERAEVDPLVIELVEDAGYKVMPVPITIAPYDKANYALYLFSRE